MHVTLAQAHCIHVTLAQAHCIHVTLAQLQLASKWFSPSLHGLALASAWFSPSFSPTLHANGSRTGLAWMQVSRRKQWRHCMVIGLARCNGETRSTLAHVSPLLLAASACFLRGMLLAYGAGGTPTSQPRHYPSRQWCWRHTPRHHPSRQW